MAAAALRPAILRRIRLSPSPSLALAAAGTGASHPHALGRWLARPMSSHDAHLTRDEVIDRILDVIKSHPKIDPSKVTEPSTQSRITMASSPTNPTNPRLWPRAAAGDPGGALREGSGARQPGHRRGGHGHRGGVQARDPRHGG